VTIASAANAYDSDAEELSPDTFLCRADDGSAVVLKKLEDDCLHDNRLHPRIRDRLARVRGVAHPRLATLRGVERTDGVPFLVWSFVAGQPVADLHDLDEPSAVAVFRAIVAAARTLHARGLVHGAIHPGNVIRTDTGDIWLTHVSPYLYDDPAADVAGVASTIEAIAEKSPEIRLPWDSIPADLEEMDALLTRMRAPVGDEEMSTEERETRPPRLRWILVALVITAIAACFGFFTNRRLPTGVNSTPVGLTRK
jgi:tRNA A-37 threonylcarbamoyl transferase component Bud32